ncbi:cytochrome b5, partial [Streptomyces katsurahamanus]|nr:cytochrome b5 [Streptomyces katsurahamanus]
GTGGTVAGRAGAGRAIAGGTGAGGTVAGGTGAGQRAKKSMIAEFTAVGRSR